MVRDTLFDGGMSAGADNRTYAASVWNGIDYSNPPRITQRATPLCSDVLAALSGAHRCRTVRIAARADSLAATGSGCQPTPQHALEPSTTTAYFATCRNLLARRAALLLQPRAIAPASVAISGPSSCECSPAIASGCVLPLEPCVEQRSSALARASRHRRTHWSPPPLLALVNPPPTFSIVGPVGAHKIPCKSRARRIFHDGGDHAQRVLAPHRGGERVVERALQQLSDRETWTTSGSRGNSSPGCVPLLCSLRHHFVIQSARRHSRPRVKTL